MADRRQTPNILTELMSGFPAEPSTAPQTDTPARRSTTRAAPTTKTSPPKEPQRKKWQYRLVSFQDYKGWRPRFINGVELSDWSHQPFIHDYLSQMADEGWELVAATSGERMYALSDKLQLYLIHKD